MAFEKYCQEVVIQDKEKAKERLSKLRADFATMLKRHPEIKHYTRWKSARPIIEGETIFRSTNNEHERRQLFEDYISDLKKAHADRTNSTRKGAMDSLIDLLPKLNLEPYTRWSEAQNIITSTQPFQQEEKYKSLSKYDILATFQNHMKRVEREFNEARQKEKNKKFRKERINRDAFISLLQELRHANKIKAGSQWSQVFPLLENDARYRAMLGQPGSSPMDLFWDIVEEEERSLRLTRNDVLDVLDVSLIIDIEFSHEPLLLKTVQDKRFAIAPKTTFQEYAAVLKDDNRTANLDIDLLKLIFERVSATLYLFK